MENRTECNCCIVVGSDVAAMPSFDDIDKILNSSGIVADVTPSDGAADSVTTPPVFGICLSCYDLVECDYKRSFLADRYHVIS